jgi:hypothetical protein
MAFLLVHGVSGDEQFEFAATTYVFTKTEEDGISTFSGSYTYTQSDSKLVVKVINVTGWAIFVVQPGQSIETTILWQDKDTFITQVSIGPGLPKTWKRQN